MSATLLLDSVILIDHFNGIEAASDYLHEVHTEAAISVITVAEVYAGFEGIDRERVRPLMDAFVALPVTKDVAELAATLRRRHRWKLPDALQAALAETHKLVFATRNTRDFPPARFPFVKVPYGTNAK
ncbi:MAG: PIN domain-containing protein [Bryobacteraceae bacterium]